MTATQRTKYSQFKSLAKLLGVKVEQLDATTLQFEIDSLTFRCDGEHFITSDGVIIYTMPYFIAFVGTDMSRRLAL